MIVYRICEHCSEVWGHSEDSQTLKEDNVEDAVEAVDLWQQDHTNYNKFGVKNQAPEKKSKIYLGAKLINLLWDHYVWSSHKR